jgi:pimeloyl-ACP methyl ester carboxylesterase
VSSPELLTVLMRGEHQAKVMVAGEGKPVVFLHGAGIPKWTAYLDGLARHYQVFAPYFPGLGGSSNSDELDLQDWWDLVLYYYDLLDALELANVDLIGHSFGGMLAAELAATDNRRFHHLLLLCAAGLWNEHLPVNSPGSTPPEQLPKLMFYDPTSELAREVAGLPEDAEERSRVILERQRVLTEIKRYTGGDKGLRRRVHRIRANTCIVWGKHDGLIPVDYAYEFQKKISDAQVKIIEKAAHFPHLEQLSEVLNITVSFLETDCPIQSTF